MRFGYNTRTGVYPRVCGGTVAPIFQNQGIHGLSPRVRGNLSNYR